MATVGTVPGAAARKLALTCPLEVVRWRWNFGVSTEGTGLARKHHKLEEIVAKLRQVEVLVGQGKPVAEGVRAIGVTEATYYRWRAEYGGLKLDQLKRLKVLEQENGRLRRAVADLTLEKLVLKEAASGNWSAPRVVGRALRTSRLSWTSRSGLPAGCWISTVRRSARWQRRPTTKRR